MNLKYSLKIAAIGLKTNRSRSLLTILGIVIGIMSIILVMSLGKGAQDLILGEIQSMGAKVIEIHPGREPKGFSDILQMFGDSLKEKDLIALQKKENLPHAKSVEPLVFGGATAVFENEANNISIYGVGEEFMRMFSVEVNKGRSIDQDDVKNRADVVIIGSKVKEDLFGNDEAIGQKIKIKNRNFKVIGTLAKKGGGSMVNFDEVSLIPWTTAQQYIFGIKYYQEILVEAESESSVDETVQDIKITLRNSHNITDSDPEKDDFNVSTQAQAMEQVGTIMGILTMFLAAVAAISLIVGGVGIMNIMLVSVTERTREIGLRKAIGATEKDILAQFLSEAVLLTIIGGLIGIILGAFFSFIASLILSKVAGLNWTFTFPVSAALLGLGVSALIGLIFGIYPARKAALKNPIDALRYE
ncbi:MAG: ABC transporter permease [Candidatus Paceibacterota bacterium]|jgi:putative ABC transport system permease protein